MLVVMQIFKTENSTTKLKIIIFLWVKGKVGYSAPISHALLWAEHSEKILVHSPTGNLFAAIKAECVKMLHS